MAELLIAMAVGVSLAIVGAELVAVSLTASKTSKARNAGDWLAEESFSAVRAIIKGNDLSSQGWNRIYLPPDGAGDASSSKGLANPYHPEIQAGVWTLVSGAETSTLGGENYTRKILIDNVSRDPGTSAIESSYNPSNNDPSTQKITVVVSKVGEPDLTFFTYFSRFPNISTLQTDWSGVLNDGPFSATGTPIINVGSGSDSSSTIIDLGNANCAGGGACLRLTAEGGVGGDGRIVYGEGTVTTPRTRKWNQSTLNWEDPESSAPAAAATIRHVIVKSAPNRDEFLVGVQTTGGSLYIQRWNGSGWSNEWNVAVGNGTLPRFDISYEQNSGEALVVYTANVGTTNEIIYRRWDGASWVGPTNYDAVSTSGIVDAIQLEARNGSDEIGLTWGDRNFDLSADFWDGAVNTWEGEPSSALSTNLSRVGSASTLTNWSFDLAFESLSGRLMVTWGINATVDPRYVIRGAGPSGTWGSTQTAAAAFEEPTDMELSSDPDSDYIAYVNNTDNGNDADACIWNGASWGPCVNFDTAVDTTGLGTTSNAVNWVTSGAQTRAVVSYDDANAAGVDWLYYNKNTDVWSALQTDFTGAPAPAGVDDKLHRLRRNPFNPSELMLLVVDANADLFTKQLVFDGSNFTWSSIEPGGAPLELTISSITGLAADFSYKKFLSSSYPATGTMISSVFDTGAINGAAYNWIMLKGPTVAGTKVRVQFAASTSTLPSTFTFLGPDCTVSTYYYDFVLPTPSESKEIKCPTQHNNKRYFRYKTILCSANDCATPGTITPQVDEVIINWSP